MGSNVLQKMRDFQRIFQIFTVFVNWRVRVSYLLIIVLNDVKLSFEFSGLTNAYLVGTLNDTAVRYNDISVLEMHHAATCFSLMKVRYTLFPNLCV